MLTAALIPSLAAILAAWATITTAVVVPGRVKRLEAKLKYVEDQLKDLYGPLLAECIRADSIFRRVELSLHHLNVGTHFGSSDPRHKPAPSDLTERSIDLKQIKVSHFQRVNKDSPGPASNDEYVFKAKVVKSVFLDSNKLRVDILKKNMHLLGPNPPTSLFLLLTHAAQMEGLVSVKEAFDINTPSGHTNEFLDPYVIQPFPFMLTAEVMAKVTYLKALQREYSRRIARTGILGIPDEIVSREKYYLVAEKQQKASTSSNSGDAGQRLRNAIFPNIHSSVHMWPLLYGPYTAIELIELRSWLIFKERPLRDMPFLGDQLSFIHAVLNSWVYAKCKGSEGRDVGIPIHYRVAQAFDDVQNKAEREVSWDSSFDWRDAARTFRHSRKQLKRCRWRLHEIPSEPGFGFNEGKLQTFEEDA